MKLADFSGTKEGLSEI